MIDYKRKIEFIFLVSIFKEEKWGSLCELHESSEKCSANRLTILQPLSETSEFRVRNLGRVLLLKIFRVMPDGELYIYMYFIFIYNVYKYKVHKNIFYTYISDFYDQIYFVLSVLAWKINLIKGIIVFFIN